ncbi:MAG: ATP-binding protein [Desulfobaccales bacterium]
MPLFSFKSLRARAIYLVLLAILPLLALTLYAYFHHRDTTIREVQRDELVAARNLALFLEILVNNSRDHLMTWAKFPQVRQRDQEGCNALFAEHMQRCPYYVSIGGGDAEGRVFASAPNVSSPSNNISSYAFFQETKRTRDFVVGEPILGRISHKYNIMLSYPLLGDAGQFQGLLWLGLDLEWLGGLLAKSDFPPVSALALTDATCKVLFRYPDPLRYIGKMLPETLANAMATRDEGVAEGVGLPGDARLFAFARLAPPWQGMRVAIGLPRDWAVGPVNRELRHNLTWLGLVGLLSMAAAWYGSGLFILQPVKKLRNVTGRLAAGDLAARAGLQDKVGELGLLAQSFDQMADSMQRRDAELKRVAAELEERIIDLDRRTAQLEAANKELESFSYSVAHDLRAPLRGIAGFSRILQEEYHDKLDEEGNRFLKNIQTDVKKMGDLIDDLLTLSRLARRQLKPRVFEMEPLVQFICQELRELEPGRKVEIHVSALPPARGDLDLIRETLWHLLVNACKFTRTRPAAVIDISGRAEAKENVYCVQDNGVGFDLQYAEKLFEPFQRLHLEGEYEGTGMGLAIVRRIIQRHHGRVWAEGKVGEGAKFCFSLPRGNLEPEADS